MMTEVSSPLRPTPWECNGGTVGLRLQWAVNETIVLLH
jgi:hypothetical protein